MRVRSLIGWLLVSAFACSDSPRTKEQLPPKLDDCVGAWETLYAREGKGAFAPETLRWHAGEIFYRQDFEDDGSVAPRYVALPEVGGERRVVAEDAGLEMWLEDDRLLYAGGDRLYSASIEGDGEAMLIADGGMFSGDPREGPNVTIFAYALGGAYLFWGTWSFEEEGMFSSLWRLARAGGASEQIARFDDQEGSIQALVAGPDELLAIARAGRAHLLSDEGTNESALPTVEGGQLIGAAPSGVLWSTSRARDGKSADELWLSKPNASKPERIGAKMPDDLDPVQAWVDEQGTWLLSAVETFSDDADHMSVWSIDADGHAKRLGCDPAPRESAYPNAGVVSDDGVFLAIQRGIDGEGWELVKVER